MSTTTVRPAPANPADHLPADSAHHLPAELHEAVRDAAIRATVAVGLGGVAVIHAVDSVGKWTETRYLFWMYMALCVTSIAIGGWALVSRSRLSLLAAAGLAASAFAGYVVNRTVGLPNAMDDIGNWVEPIGLASLVVEGIVVVAATCGALLAGRTAGR